jgi:hypothetical protein
MIIDGPMHDVWGSDDAGAACLGDLDREEAQ